MKVRLRFGMAGPLGSYRAGTVVDLPADKAKYLIETRQADVVDKIETATVKAPEQAARTKAPEPREVSDLTFPQAVGGGWYLLSNGEKIHGKEKAAEAEAALEE